MHTFKVVKEPYGWAVCIDHGMSTPFWSRATAIQEADCLCSAIRGHGEAAEVVIEEIDSSDMLVTAAKVGARRLTMLLKSWPPAGNDCSI